MKVAAAPLQRIDDLRTISITRLATFHVRSDQISLFLAKPHLETNRKTNTL
jgi:hypothetical protein